jgi:hypothetical protein
MISWLLAENIISQSANRIRYGLPFLESGTEGVGVDERDERGRIENDPSSKPQRWDGTFRHAGEAPKYSAKFGVPVGLVGRFYRPFAEKCKRTEQIA